MAKGDLTIEIDNKTWNKANLLLNKLEAIDQNRIIDKALRRGQAMIKTASMTNYMRGASNPNTKATGKLNQTYRVTIKKTAGMSKSNQGFSGAVGHVAHLVDRGTAARFTKKGAYRGIMYKGKKTKYYTPTGDGLRGFWSRANAKMAFRAMATCIKTVMDGIRKIYNTSTI